MACEDPRNEQEKQKERSNRQGGSQTPIWVAFFLGILFIVGLIICGNAFLASSTDAGREGRDTNGVGLVGTALV